MGQGPFHSAQGLGSGFLPSPKIFFSTFFRPGVAPAGGVRGRFGHAAASKAIQAGWGARAAVVVRRQRPPRCTPARRRRALLTGWWSRIQTVLTQCSARKGLEVLIVLFARIHGILVLLGFVIIITDVLSDKTTHLFGLTRLRGLFAVVLDSFRSPLPSLPLLCALVV